MEEVPPGDVVEAGIRTPKSMEPTILPITITKVAVAEGHPDNPKLPVTESRTDPPAAPTKPAF